MERFTSRVEDMDRSADYQRDFNVFMLSARGETQTKDFFQWAGGEKVTLAIVFTDVVGSTFLGQTFGDERMSIMRNAHFRQGRSFIKSYNGREIKSIGDSLMAAFHSVHDALDFALALHKNTGDKKIKIRAGIHIGALQVEESDIFGGTVNFAARVVGAINGPEIWLSERAKQDIDQLKSQKHSHLKWIKHDDVDMKGFNGKFILWSLVIV
jgi:class 3 adenylate cyclase